jgi:hypothetical protein
MPHIFTHTEHADMLYIYSLCDGSTTAGVEDYSRRFPVRIIPDRSVFQSVRYIVCIRCASQCSWFI